MRPLLFTSVVAPAHSAILDVHIDLMGCCCGTSMQRLRHYVGPSWPPDIGAYDYALTLCPSELAWEFLRRNPAYQRDYRLSRRGRQRTRRLKGGRQLTRVRRYTPRSGAWGLHPFRRSGAAGTASPGLLAGKRGCPRSRGDLRSRQGRRRSRSIDR
jgi:hypothetical protein